MTINKNDKPKPRRALVLQGGGSLGAYESGVFKAIYQHLIDEEGENPEKNLFDIVAGTSIGAINAAILVSYVKENKTWEGSVEKLEDFWKKQLSSTPNLSTYGPFYLPYFWSDKSWSKIWDEQHMIKSETATGEAARRYYSTKEFLFSGAPKVFSPEPEFPIYDNKFFDNNALLPNNIWFRYSNQPLRDSIEKYAEFPIATSSDNEEPRLILVSVDVEEGETVTFDSYEYKGKECKICEKRCDEDNKESDNNELVKHVYKDHRKISYKEGDDLRWSVYGDEHNRHAIFYDGIELDHVVASASVPLNYDYTKIKAIKSVINIDDNTFKEEEDRNKDLRHFWDGGLLSNTPLRELIGEHKTFWEKKLGIDGSTKLLDEIWKGGGEQEGGKSEFKIPDLDVYIVNLWPPKEYEIPKDDHDVIKDRKNDITYHDKTEYDQKVATFVTDYIDLSWDLIKLAKKNNLPKKDIEKILKKRAKSRQRSGKARKYEDLVTGRFDMRRVVRIERKDDHDTISNKSFDFSSGTIQQLIEKGYKEAKIQIKIESKVQSLIDKIDKIIDLHANENENEKERGKIDQDKITLLERKLLGIKTIYLKQEDDHLEAFKEYLDEFLNRIGNYAIERPEQIKPLIDEVNRFHENLKEMGVQ